MPESYTSQIASYGRPAGTYIPEYPYEFAIEAGATKQKKIDDTFKQLDLLGQPFNYLRTPNTELKAQEIKSDIDSRLNELSSTDPTSPEFGPKFHALKKEIISRRSPGGDIHALETDYSNFLNLQKESSEMIGKKTLMGSTWEELQTMRLEEYDKNIGNVIKGGQGKPIFDARTPAQFEDIRKDSRTIANEIKARKIDSIGGWQNLGINLPEKYQQIVTKITSLPAEEIEAIVLDAIKDDPKYKDFIGQEFGVELWKSNKLQPDYQPTKLTAEGASYAQATNPDLDIYTPQGQKALTEGQRLADIQDRVFNKYFGRSAESAGSVYRQYEKDYQVGTLSSTAGEEDIKNKKLMELQEWESKLTVVGPKGTSNIKNIAESEPTNSILAKVYGFINPVSQAKGLLNFASWYSPVLKETLWFKEMDKKLEKDSQLSEDQVDNIISQVGDKIKIEAYKDQKLFKDKFGFSNPVYNQVYDIARFLTDHTNPEKNPDYERVKKITSQIVQGFDQMSKKDQFRIVTEKMTEFQNTLKTDPIDTPINSKQLEDTNKLLLSLKLDNLDTDESKRILGTIGLSSNSTFVDTSPTGKGEPIPLDKILEKGSLQWQGSNRITNSYGPGMQYFVGGDGRTYYSPGALNDQRENWIQWNMNQLPNRYNKSHEFPLYFGDKRNQKPDETIPENIPQAKIEQDVNTGQIYLDVKVSPSEKITIGKENKFQNTPELLSGMLLKYFEEKKYPVEELKKMGW